MIKLNAQTREVGAKMKNKDLIPAVVYSQGKVGLNLAVQPVEFEKIYHQAGESTLVDLVIDGKTEKKVLIHDMQMHPTLNKFLHVDFYEVDLNKKVETKVELEFVGEAPVVKNEGGVVIKKISELDIECLPGDLIKKFKVDISGLTDFTSAIHVKDLKISDKITILNNMDDVVVNVSEPRIVEEEKTSAEGSADGEGAAGDKASAESKDSASSDAKETKTES